MKRLAIFLLAAVATFMGCGLLKKPSDDNSSLLLLLGAAVLLSNQGCQNSSGLVICIPPGFRQ